MFARIWFRAASWTLCQWREWGCGIMWILSVSVQPQGVKQIASWTLKVSEIPLFTPFCCMNFFPTCLFWNEHNAMNVFKGRLPKSEPRYSHIKDYHTVPLFAGFSVCLRVQSYETDMNTFACGRKTLICFKHSPAFSSQHKTHFL